MNHWLQSFGSHANRIDVITEMNTVIHVVSAEELSRSEVRDVLIICVLSAIKL